MLNIGKSMDSLLFSLLLAGNIGIVQLLVRMLMLESCKGSNYDDEQDGMTSNKEGSSACRRFELCIQRRFG